MRWLRTVVREIVGLFVDDGSFALWILVWIGVNVYLLPRLGLQAAWRGWILFGGLAAILVESATRFGRRRAREGRAVKPG